MAWFDWLNSWNASIEFGVAAVLALLGAECLVLAWKGYKRTRAEHDEAELLGAEFGVFTAASSMRLRGEPAVPRNCYLLAAAGAASLTASMVLMTYSFV